MTDVATATTTAVVWTCVVCGQAIEDDEGYLTASFAELHEYERRVREWEAEHAQGFYTLREVLDYPRAVPWQVLHEACDPEPDASSYWIGVERIRTPAAVLAWAAHLGEKNWIQTTNWTALLRGIAGQLGGAAL